MGNARGKIAALLFTLVASCGGGGGSREEPFTPSTDLLETHRWLYDYVWAGEARSASGGPPLYAAVNVTTALINAGGLSMWECSTVLSPLYVGQGLLQADGNRLQVETLQQSPILNARRCFVALARIADDRLVGTYRIEETDDGSLADRGSIDLTGFPR